MPGFMKTCGAEFLKMRHTFLYRLHIAVPVIGCAVFLFYYSAAGWSETAQISGFIEMIGIALPLLTALVCAGNAGLEEENHFQIFLGASVCKPRAFHAKWLVLELLALMSILAAVVMFAFGYRFVLGKEGISIADYGALVLLLCIGSVPLYLEHLFLNFMFPRPVSLGIGVAQFLLSALFLTGLGDGRWQFFPCTWSARGAALFLALTTRKELSDILGRELRTSAVICLLITAAIYAIIRTWFHFYEGRKYND